MSDNISKKKIHSRNCELTDINPFQRFLNYLTQSYGNIILNLDYIIMGCDDIIKEKYLKNKTSISGKHIDDIISVIKDEKHENINVIRKLSQSDYSTPVKVQFLGIDNFACIVPITFWDQYTAKHYSAYRVAISDNCYINEDFYKNKLQNFEELSKNIAHNFNNLLTGVIGFCDQIFKTLPKNNQLSDDAIKIKRNSIKTTKIVEQLLVFTNQQIFMPKIFDIIEYLNDIYPALKDIAGEKIKLQITHNPKSVLVEFDPKYLEVILIDIITNITTLSKNNCTLTISTQILSITKSNSNFYKNITEGKYLKITFTNNNSNNSNASENYQLASQFINSYNIISNTNAFMYVNYSEKENIILLLPQHPVPLAKDIMSSIKIKRPILTNVNNILLVEDEEIIRNFITRELENLGYKVQQAKNGMEAISYLNKLYTSNKKHPDLLITDVMMPKLNGLELAKKATLLFPKLKILYLSGYMEETLRSTISQKKSAFLSKPFSIESLVNKVTEIITNDL